MNPVRIALIALSVLAPEAVAETLVEPRATPPVIHVSLEVLQLASRREGIPPIPARQLKRFALTANRVWAQCAIEFQVRGARTVDADTHGLPARPQSQADLSKIHDTLFPAPPQRSIPLHFAGIWGFFDPASQIYLHGLGWYFLTGEDPLRSAHRGIKTIGAMIGSEHLAKDSETLGDLIGHELGHALSLQHTHDGSLMGSNRGLDGDRSRTLTGAQCDQARHFAKTYL